jgi:hypothetical protein
MGSDPLEIGERIGIAHIGRKGRSEFLTPPRFVSFVPNGDAAADELFGIVHNG